MKGARKQDFWVYDTYPCSMFSISVESIKVIIENEILYQALDIAVLFKGKWIAAYKMA